MAKSNGQCGVGVAYECNLGGLKIDTSSSFATASALRYNKNYIDIYSISWGPADWGFVVHAPTYLTEFILKDGVQNVN